MMPLCSTLFKKLQANDSLKLSLSNPAKGEKSAVDKHLHSDETINSSKAAHSWEGERDFNDLPGTQSILLDQHDQVFEDTPSDNSRTLTNDAPNFTADTSWPHGESETKQEVMTSSFQSIIGHIVEGLDNRSQINTNHTLPFNNINLNYTVLQSATNSTISQGMVIATAESESVFIHEFQLIKAVVLIVVLTFLMLSTCKIVLQSSAKHGQTKDEAA